MAEIAAHLADHVFPRLSVRQWVLSVPKRLRYFLQNDAAVQGVVLRLLLRVVERGLREHSPGCGAQARIGAVAFIHRFGSSLNEHVQFHCCVVDGVFEPADDTDEVTGVVFHAVSALDAAALRQVQVRVRQRTLHLFVRRGPLDKADGKAMGQRDHGGGFSVGASVCIEGTDRPGLERLLRYCARPPFALEHLQQLDAKHLCYHNPRHKPDEPGDLVLTPLELIDKVAALVPPPQTHRHRYYGVLAPNSPLRAAVTALARVAVPPPADTVRAEEEPCYRATSRYLWAMLLAQIYEAFPLTCPFCHAEMWIIAFINEASVVRKILDHIGESTRPPSIAPARGPPLWEAATVGEQAGNDRQWDDLLAPPAPEFEFDQRIAW